MTRETSAIAHAEESDLGKLSLRRRQAIMALIDAGTHGLTANEAWLRVHAKDPACMQHSLSPRFAELRDRGFIAEAGERECSVTHKTAIVWKFVSKRATNLFPTRKQATLTAKAKLKKIADLCDEHGDVPEYKTILRTIKTLATACILIAALALPGCSVERKAGDAVNPCSACREIAK